MVVYWSFYLVARATLVGCRAVSTPFSHSCEPPPPHTPPPDTAAKEGRKKRRAAGKSGRPQRKRRKKGAHIEVEYETEVDTGLANTTTTADDEF